MFAHLEESAARADRESRTTLDALHALRRLSLDEFGQVLGALPKDKWPNLTKLLPAMSPESVQKEWTGSAGDTLLRQSTSFMNFVVSTFTEVTGHPIRGKNVLDFGCGWGRLLRLLSFFNDPEFNHGCDAWPVSLGHCQSANIDRVAGTIKKSDEVPTELPFGDTKFDLVYAFSIFTHLSQSCATACMAAIRKSITPEGVAIISVRPLEFWDFHQRLPADVRQDLHAAHLAGDVAFYPAGNSKNYGDTSIPLNLLPTLFPGWEIVRSGTTMIDPYQVFVVLRPI